MENNKLNLSFEVKRIRLSDNRGSAEVWCNGIMLASFEDNIRKLRPGDSYYGDIVSGWASVAPDAAFISTALFHPLNRYYHFNRPVEELISDFGREQKPSVYETPAKRYTFGFVSVPSGEYIELAFEALNRADAENVFKKEAGSAASALIVIFKYEDGAMYYNKTKEALKR